MYAVTNLNSWCHVDNKAEHLHQKSFQSKLTSIFWAQFRFGIGKNLNAHENAFKLNLKFSIFCFCF